MVGAFLSCYYSASTASRAFVLSGGKAMAACFTFIRRFPNVFGCMEGSDNNSAIFTVRRLKIGAQAEQSIAVFFEVMVGRKL